MRTEDMSIARSFKEANPEADLLLSMLRLRNDPSVSPHINKILAKQIHWERFVSLALRNEVLPSISRLLLDKYADAVPGDIAAFLNDRFHRNLQRNAVLCRELIWLNELFSAHGIQIINYKGPETQFRMDMEIDECQFNDLDFLVREEQEATIRSLLLSHGYHLEMQGKDNGLRKDYTYIREKNDDGTASVMALPGDIYAQGRIIIEPHLHITEYRLPVRIDRAMLWEHIEYTEFMGKASLPVLAEDVLLLVLCVAGCKASWKNLKLINHVASLVRTIPGSSIDRCIEKAERAGCARMVAMGLLLAGELLGAPVNLKTIARANSAGLVRCAEKIASARSQSVPPPINYHPFPWKYSPVIMRTLDRPQDKARYFWRTTTQPYPVHYSRFPLPSFLRVLYRVIVPIHDYLLVPAGQLLKWCIRSSKSGAHPTHEALHDFLNKKRRIDGPRSEAV